LFEGRHRDHGVVACRQAVDGEYTIVTGHGCRNEAHQV
jgi:hypothetical protein